MVALKVRVQLEDFNAQEEEKRLLSDRGDIGAIISLFSSQFMCVTLRAM